VQANQFGEDDVILLGDLNADERHFGQLARVPDITWVIAADTPTNTRGDKTYDNLLFSRRTTIEFTGHGGVLDLVREFNLGGVDQAGEISDHLPVWAEFSIYENGQPTAVAGGSADPPR
jgi:endonuclease/exonuclease/phosphatase family metal-dependent hydrolase